MQNRITWIAAVATTVIASVFIAGCEQEGIVAVDAGVDAVSLQDSAVDAQPADLQQNQSDAQPPRGWAISFGGDEGAAVWGIEVDGSGNLIVLGGFKTAMTIKGVDGDIELTDPEPTNPGSKLFIAKLDPTARKFLWGFALEGEAGPAFGAQGWEPQNGFGVDTAGNSYVSGMYEGSATFGATTLESKGGRDIFVVKLDPDGKVVWARSAGGPGHDEAIALVVGTDNTITICGMFSETAAFDSHSITSGCTPDGLVCKPPEPGVPPVTGPNDLYAARLDADDGSFEWAVGAGSGSDLEWEWAETIALDGAGNTYIGGSAGGGAKFGHHTLPGKAGQETAFVAMLDPQGAFGWVHALPAHRTHAIALDDNGTIYVAAGSRVPITYDVPFWDNVWLVAKGSDSDWVWNRLAISTMLSQATDLLVGGKGNVAVSGWVSGELSLGSTALTSGTGKYIGFFAQLDASGSFTAAEPLAASKFLTPTRLARDKTGGVFVAGYFGGTVDLGGTTLTSRAAGSSELPGSDAGGDAFIWYTGRVLQ